MSPRFLMLVLVSVLSVPPAVARSQTTDEARALAGKMLPRDAPPRPAPADAIAGTTDEARAMAGRSLARTQEATPKTIQAIGTTDEARAVAGGVLVVAPMKQEEKVAKCGSSCDCTHHG